MNYLRTAVLLAGLTALFMAIGYVIGGGSGALTQRVCDRTRPRACGSGGDHRVVADALARRSGGRHRPRARPCQKHTLTMTITATIAGAISMLAQFGLFF